MSKPTGFLCGPRIYEYKGWTFEYGYCGPWPLKKDGQLRARAGRKFFAVATEWCKREDRETFRVGGGCQAI